MERRRHACICRGRQSSVHTNIAQRPYHLLYSSRAQHSGQCLVGGIFAESRCGEIERPMTSQHAMLDFCKEHQAILAKPNGCEFSRLPSVWSKMCAHMVTLLSWAGPASLMTDYAYNSNWPYRAQPTQQAILHTRAGMVAWNPGYGRTAGNMHQNLSRTQSEPC